MRAAFDLCYARGEFDEAVARCARSSNGIRSSAIATHSSRSSSSFAGRFDEALRGGDASAGARRAVVLRGVGVSERVGVRRQRAGDGGRHPGSPAALWTTPVADARRSPRHATGSATRNRRTPCISSCSRDHGTNTCSRRCSRRRRRVRGGVRRRSHSSDTRWRSATRYSRPSRATHRQWRAANGAGVFGDPGGAGLSHPG